MISSQEAHRPNPNPSPFVTISHQNFLTIQDNQDFFCFMRSEERLSRPRPFFSKNGLSQDIIQVTDAEPDVCLEVFYALYHTLWPQIGNQSSVSLKDAWTNFVGGSIMKGVLCSPEKLIGKKKLKYIKKLLSESEGEKQIFQDLDQVINSISHLKQKISEYSEQLLQQEEILAVLDLVERFYQGYRNQVKASVQAIVEKEYMNVACVSEYDALVDLLEPKAVMMTEASTGHWAYRITRNKAQKLLSLDENGRPLKNDSSEPSNHRVAALPEKTEAPEPLVYFKANGRIPIQPEKEFMLYSLYQHLQIPVPETALIILTDVFEENTDDFYAVQASEAVVGQPAAEALKNQETIFEEEAFVKQVIGTLLTNPSDGSFKNFKYSPHYKTLIGIDNDEVFKPELSGDNSKIVNVKSILYLLPQIDLAIPEAIKTFFTTLDPHLIIFSWLKGLSMKNKEYNLLYTRLPFQKARYIYQNLLPQSEIPHLAMCLQEEIQVDPDLHHDDSFSPQILISKDLLSSVLEKLQVIEKALLNNRSASAQILFEEVSPILGKYYRKLRLEFSDPEEALEALWGEKKKGIDYSEILSILSNEEFESLFNNKNYSDENLLPEKFFNKYKQKLIFGERPLDQFIKRHSQRKMEKLLNLSRALEELRLLIQEGLTDSRSPRDIVDFCENISKMTEVDDHLRKEITLLFSNIPNAELKWLFTLEKYFFRAENDVSENMRRFSIAINDAFLKQRIFILTESAKQEIFDEQGNIKKDTSLPGRSNVTCFPKLDPEFYLKQYPEWPGYEFASILFMRMIGLTRLPYQDLMIVDDKYPVLLTQKVDGDPVFRVWQNPEAFRNLDPFHTGLLIIAAMLLNPEDGKEDNYILSPDGKYLIPIDNDHCFLPSTFQKEGSFWNAWTVNTALQTKTLLFCLDEMKKPIPNEVRQYILDLDFDLLLKLWMKELIKIEDRYNYLVGEKQRDAFLENGTVLRIPFYEQFINTLYSKVNKIQDLLRKDILKTTSELTPFSLLKEVEPFVAKCYQDSFQHGDTLQSRFKAVTNKLYIDIKSNLSGSRMSILNTQSMMNIINVSEKDLQDDIAYHKMGPSDALELLKQLIEERGEKRKMEQDLLCELDDKSEESIWTALFGNPLVETALNNFFGNPKEGLVLKGSRLITSSKLINLFAQTPDQGIKIKFLSFPNSPLLDSKTIRTLVEGCPNLGYLNVSGCVKLEEIITVKGEWPFLSRLEARDCLNLKRLGSCSPIKILRIGTHQRIEIFIEKHVLDIFAMSTQTNQFDFLLEKRENFEIMPLEKNMFPVDFLQTVLLEKKKFYQYFTNPKITIGTHSILSAIDLTIFITSLDLRNPSTNNEKMKGKEKELSSKLENLELSFSKTTGTTILESLVQRDWPTLNYLNLSSHQILDEGLLTLSQGNWPLLETLNLQNTGITSVGVPTIVERSNCSQLKSLNLSQNPGIEDEAIQKLAQGNWPLLEKLDLSLTGVTKRGLLEFIVYLNWPNLKELIFQLKWMTLSKNLLRWSLCTTLDLSSSEVTQKEVETLVKKIKWFNMGHLDLSYNKIGDEGLVTLSQGNWPFLRNLNLEKTQITSVGVQVIAERSKWPNLRQLNLSCNEINDEVFAMLPEANWPKLEKLNLNKTQVTEKGSLNFLLVGKSSQIKEINFPSWWDHAYVNFANYLIKYNPGVKELQLNNLGLTFVELHFITKKYKFKLLKYLNISDNEIADEGLSLLSLAEWPLLEELNVQNTNITSKGVETIVNQSKWKQLKCLNISNNKLFDEGIFVLALTEWPLLEELYIRNIKITLEGTKVLVDKMKLINLKKLDISENALFDQGMKILTLGKWPKFQHLIYYDTQVTLKGNISFLENSKWSNLHHLEHSRDESFFKHSENPNNRFLSEIILATAPIYYQKESILMAVLDTTWLNSKKIYLSTRHNGFKEKFVIFPRDQLGQLEEIQLSPWTSPIQFIVWPSNLKILNISNNPLSDEKEFENLFFSKCLLLQDLNLRNTKISIKSIEILVSKSDWPRLKKLDVSWNSIQNEGLRTLSSGRWPLLENLNLQSTNLTDEGLASIISTAKWPNLKVLDLSYNQHLLNEGCEIFASGKWPPLLEILSLNYTNITLENVETLIEKSSWPNLKEIYLVQETEDDDEINAITQLISLRWPNVKLWIDITDAFLLDIVPLRSRGEKVNLGRSCERRGLEKNDSSSLVKKKKRMDEILSGIAGGSMDFQLF